MRGTNTRIGWKPQITLFGRANEDANEGKSGAITPTIKIKSVNFRSRSVGQPMDERAEGYGGVCEGNDKPLLLLLRRFPHRCREMGRFSFNARNRVSID